MAKQIKKGDILENNILKDAIDEAKALYEWYEKLDQINVKLAKDAQKTAESLDFSKAKDIQKLSEVQAKLNTAKKNGQKIDQDKVKLQKQLQSLTDKEVKGKLKLQQANKLQRDILKENLVLENKEAGTLQKLQVANRKLRRERELLNLETAKGRKRLQEINLALDRNNLAIRKNSDNMKRQKLNIGNYQSALGKLGGVASGVTKIFGALGLAMGLGQIVRSAFNTIKDFDQSMANLAAVTGKNIDEMGVLEAEIRRLGGTTSYTAAEVAGLATELAKLGFSEDEILNSTEAILNFAKATGADLSEAAALGGSTLRAFNLEASEMERVVSVMGVATSKSALDFSKLNTAMSTVAPVASSLGFSLEDTTALLGSLSNAGFDASSAATSTRNILLNLADSNGKLAKELGRPINNLEDLSLALGELDARGIDLASSLELTDKRSVAAFQTFLKGANSMTALRDSITDVDDELKTMAETQDATVTGSLARLNSAWQEFILKMNDGSGAGKILITVLDFLAENLETIIEVIFRLANPLYTVVETIYNLGEAVGLWGSGMELATGITNNLTKAQKENYKILQKQKSITNDMLQQSKDELSTTQTLLDVLGEETATREEKADAMERLRDIHGEYFETLLDEEGQIKDLDAAYTSLNAKILENAFNKIKAARIDETMNTLVQKSIDLRKLEGETIDVFGAKIDKANIAQEELNQLTEEHRLEMEAMQRVYEDLPEIAEKYASTINADYDLIINKITDVKNNLIEVNNEMKGASTWEMALLKKEASEYEAQLKSLEEQRKKLLASKGVGTYEQTITPDGTSSKKSSKSRSQKKDVDNTEKYYLELRKLQLENQEKSEQLEKETANLQLDITLTKLREKMEAEKGNVEALALLKEQEKQIYLNYEIEITDIEKKYQEQRQKNLDDAIKKRDESNSALRDSQLENTTQFLDNEVQNTQTEIDKIQEEIDEAGRMSGEQKTSLITLIEQRANLAKESLKAQMNEELLDLFEDYIDELEALDERIGELKKKKDLEGLTEEENQELQTILDNRLKIQEKYEVDNLTIKEKYAQQNQEVNKEEEESLEELDKKKKELSQADKQKAMETVTTVYSALADKRMQKIDEEISKIDELIKKSEESEDRLRKLRDKGVKDAADNLAFEQRRQNELEKKKLELEKKKRREEMITTALETYGNKVANGDPNPLASTITDMALLQAFIQGMPAFWGGTDTTVGDSIGYKYSSGRDGIIARVDKSEMILNKEKSDRLKGMTTDEITDISEAYKNGYLVEAGKVGLNNDYTVTKTAMVNYDSDKVVSKLNEQNNRLESVEKHLKYIAKKPTPQVDFEKYGTMLLEVEKRKSLGKSTTNIKRVR